jgi:hypothetical protein
MYTVERMEQYSQFHTLLQKAIQEKIKIIDYPWILLCKYFIPYPSLCSKWNLYSK